MGWTRDGSEGDWTAGVSGRHSLSHSTLAEPPTLQHGCRVQCLASPFLSPQSPSAWGTMVTTMTTTSREYTAPACQGNLWPLDCPRVLAGPEKEQEEC